MKRVFILFGMLLFVGSTLFGQQITVTGTVTDAAEGETLPGVTIQVQGTTVGTVTDMDGNYEITAPADGTLVFSFVGMVTREVPVEGRNVIDVALESDAVGLEEVLVVAYGTTTRESFTGVADVVGSDRIERRAVSDVSRALEGTSPGIQVTSGGGQPGEGQQIRLRGFGSISASSEPLIVVDGAPFDGDLSDINPNDIENMSVLRDASAAALYGARGANGVVMITTKRGDDAAPSMNFRSSFGAIDRTMPDYPQVDERDFMMLTWEADRNMRHFEMGMDLEAANQEAAANLIGNLGGYNPFDMPAEDFIQVNPDNPWLADFNPNANLLWSDDWKDHIFRTAVRHEHQFSVSGGTEMSDYYVSLGYLDEQGIAVTSGFDRISGRVNVNTQPTEWFETGFNLSGSMTESDYLLAEGTAITNPFYFTRGIGPIYPVYVRNEDGSYMLDEAGEKIFDYGTGVGPQGSRPTMGNANLAGTLELDDRSNVRENVSGRTFARFHILPNLQFETNLSADYYSQYTTTFQNPQFGDAAGVGGRGTKQYTRNLSMTFNQLINYDRSFGDHNFDFLLGHEAYRMQFNLASATRSNYPVPGITEIGIATTMEGSNSYQHEYTVEGYFSRLNYDYDNRYYGSVSYRRDGSSRFHADNRWGNFFSLGASWRMTQEEFMQDIDWLDNLRLKFSYGEQGNDGLPSYYAWQAFYDLGYPNLDRHGALYTRLENKDLVWETNANTNIGFDFRVFDRIEAEVDYFIRESDNLLFQVPQPLSTGMTSYSMNIGSMENRGVEFRMLIDLVQRQDFYWNFDFNITHVNNEITYMPEELEGMVDGTKRLDVGTSLYDYWLREVSHIDPETGATHYYYDITDENGEPTGERGTTSNHLDADRYYVGTAIPDAFGGFTNNINYRNWDFSMLFTYSIGGETYDGVYGGMFDGRFWAGDYGSALHADRVNRWRQPGDETGQPRVQQGSASLYAGTSDNRLFDMTYLSLKNVTLGYNLPAELAQRFGMTSMRVYATGDNLFIWNDNEGMDPQHSFAGTTDYTFVPVRTMTFGVNLQF